MMNAVNEIQRLLLNIHSMSELLTSHHCELIDSGRLKHDPDDLSDPILSIAEIIKDKTESCYRKSQLLEEHFFALEAAEIGVQ